MLHTHRRSDTGDAFVCGAAAQTWCHDAFVCMHSEKQIMNEGTGDEVERFIGE